MKWYCIVDKAAFWNCKIGWGRIPRCEYSKRGQCLLYICLEIVYLVFVEIFLLKVYYSRLVP